MPSPVRCIHGRAHLAQEGRHACRCFAGRRLLDGLDDLAADHDRIGDLLWATAREAETTPGTLFINLPGRITFAERRYPLGHEGAIPLPPPTNGELWLAVHGEGASQARARALLARALLAVNTPVEVVLLPAGEHDHKVGLDDWLMTGKRLKDFRKLPRFPIEDLPKTKREVVRELGLMLGDKGKVLANYSNTLNYLEHQHAADLYTDQYLGAFFKGEPYRDEVHDSLLLRELEELNPAWPRRHVEAARRQLLATNTRNGIGEWLEGLVWDGKARLATFFASSPMRSRSLTILVTIMIRRRSTAVG